MESYGSGTVTRLVKIRHFLNLIARGDRVKRGLSLSMTRQLTSLPRHPKFCSVQRCTRRSANSPSASEAVRVWIASLDFTDGSTSMKVFQKT
jgi:hypothetical protein